MININTIKFIDIAALEKTAQHRAQAEFGELEKRKDKLGSLSEADQLEYDRLHALVKKSPPYFDPLFVCTRAELASNTSGLQPVNVAHEEGTLEIEPPGLGTTAAAKSVPAKSTGGRSRPADEGLQITRVALVLGLLQLDRAPLPKLVVRDNEKEAAADTADPNLPRFREALFRAVGRAAGRLSLAEQVLQLMADAVAIRAGGDNQSAGVSSLEFAKTFTRLADAGIDADDPNLRRRVDETLDTVQDLKTERPFHELEIDLPDLESVSIDIKPDHCKLFGSFIFASAFDELRAFQVIDTLIDMSQRGSIALVRGPAGTQLYNYWRAAPNRMTESERQTFYAMTLGLPTGQPGVAVNVEFQDLWLRFVSSVSSLVREIRVDQLLRSKLPVAINQQQVKKAARDLAVNMSARGYGMVFYAAIDLQKQINEMIALLQDQELRAAFGARDMWGVIDQVAATELGGARNSSRYRMLATSGAIITSWMAKNVDRMKDPTLQMIDVDQISNPPRRMSGQTAVSAPTDYDLVNACEMWLADSAFGGERVEQLAQPRESPQQPSRPIQIPSIARDLLEGAGLGLGMGVSMGGGRNGAAGRQANGHGRYSGY